jgi:hypothetical protein
MKSQYKNNGKRWSNEEDEQLIQELSQNISFEELSNIHQRSISAIKGRIFIKAVNDHKNGVTIEVIYSKYNLNETTFHEALEYVKKMENKKEDEKGEKKKEIKKEKVEQIQQVGESDLNTLLLKELLLEMREIKLMMKEFLINFEEKSEE